MNMLVVEGVSLKSFTTLKTGGAARYLITVTTIEELKTAVSFAQQKTLPFFVIGSGSNLLAPDSGYDGVIIRIDIKGCTYEEIDGGAVLATFGAGEILDEVIADTVNHNYWGLENLSHIPGTVGATPIQNVGAYGVEVSDLITTVEVYDTESHTLSQLSNCACEFLYRDSLFKTTLAKKYIITSVTFCLQTMAMPRLSYSQLQAEFKTKLPTQPAIRESVIAIRSAKFPDWNTVGTAGSFFKNPIISREHAEGLLLEYPLLPTYAASAGKVKVSLGYILDKVCGLRGYTKGQLRLYEAQALVLVAGVGATSAEIEIFAADVREQVFLKTKIKIEFEVTRII